MSLFRTAMALTLTAAVSLPASARRGDDDFCTSAPRAEWLPIAAVVAKAKELGYSVWKSEISGTCYEVYGRKGGADYELYFDPKTGALVKIERE